jgi:signal transduction histidine kinase/HD-like signal output (HDOD) protein/CheY-like chemotaxis protein
MWHDIPRNQASRVRALIAGIEQLPSAPASAGRILAIVTCESPDLLQLVDAVESDPAVSLRVLRLANSAAFQQMGEATDIRQAAMRLGTDAVCNAALCVSVREGLFKTFDNGDPLVRGFWRHSLACASAARLLATRLRPGLAGKAFAAGLFHDCGQLALVTTDPGAYSAIMGDEFLVGERLLQAEQDVMGVDHCLVGKWLLERWELPEVFSEAAWLHHHHATVLLGAGEPSLVSLIVALADRLALEAMGILPVGSHDAETLGAASVLGFDSQESLQEVRAGIGQLFSEHASLFDLREDAGSFYFDALSRANRRLGAEGLRLAEESRIRERAARALRQVGLAGVEIARADTVSEVLLGLARCMRDRFGASGGLAFVVDADGGLARGHLWGFGTGLRPVVFPLDADQALEGIPGEGGGLPPEVGRLLSGCRARASALASPDGPPIHFQDGLAIVCVTGAAQGLGELMYQPPSGTVSTEEHAAVSLLAQLAAQAFRRLELTRSCESRSERLAQLMNSMRDMNDKLLKTQRLAAVGQLAAGAAHEINNPLAIISARAQLLEMREEDPAKKKGLRQMVEQIDRISAILGSLMDFARPAAPRMESMNPRDVMDRVLGLLEGGLSGQGITVRKDYRPSIPDIKADSRQLEQVLLNLALNAQHAMEGRGGVLTAGIFYQPEGDSVAFTVADTGVGILPEHLEKIFDPFFTTKAEGKGTGLGLSTAYGIVQAHKGRIAVESKPGLGARFTVVLPRDPSGKVPADSETQRRRSPRQAVLVVDDERHIREILKESLESNGYSVEVASDGEQALALLRKNIYQLLILDIRMPGRDGLALLREAGGFAGASMPVLVLTGMASEQEILEAKSLGAAACMRKPFQVDALLAQAASLLAPRDGGSALGLAGPGPASS